MFIAGARVQTERSSRYLTQLCQHLDKVGRAHPQMGVRVEWSDVHGTISLDQGRCTLRALPDALVLVVEASDADTLQLVEQRVADRLQQVGRHDGLTVSWTPTRSAGAESADAPARSDSSRTDQHAAAGHDAPGHHMPQAKAHP